jgi:Lrp/AsnC family transcriptional regulator, leucine-responsive regulatory protein
LRSEPSDRTPRNARPRNGSPAQGGMRLDGVDLRILGLLQADARISSADLAREVALSPPGVQKRLRKLEERGVIERYATIIQREAIGLDLLCIVQVSLAHHEPRIVEGFREAVRAMPEVLECHYLTGEFDYLLKVVVANHQHLEQFLFEKLTRSKGVDKIRTSIVLNEIKHSTSLPLGSWDHDGERWVGAKDSNR